MILDYKIKEEAKKTVIGYNDDQLLTFCPFKKNVKIASSKCWHCRFYIVNNPEKHTLQCAWRKK